MRDVELRGQLADPHAARFTESAEGGADSKEFGVTRSGGCAGHAGNYRELQGCYAP